MMALHWLTALAVVVAYVISGDPTQGKSALDVLVGQTHVATGLLIATLVVMRLPMRFLLNAPPPVAASAWQQKTATLVHVALYALLFVVPLAGWAALSGKTQAFAIVGIALPLLNAKATWVGLLGDAHQTLGNAFIWLAGLHAVAALWHHYWMRDSTLTRMLPWLKRRGV